ncbi:DNA polymerase III subunit delta [Gracilibacillus alcaliphilus]|uniref:DNA polymerase III subunit delta n=1 Tax=Gracilibacillus alcaliphilus TaxID=1401441 RepID=UPI00195EE8DF|nr:DNA polymerase III subunit delta [Gracilibacillus alcaliphilus]MBM7678875.1 DNA polymerase-3 subunit delta [Gracilibacillus alcaliphilus]
MDYLTCVQAIKKKNFEAVYYLHGTEEYMMEAIKQALIEYGMPEEEQDTNLSIYDLEETSIQEVITDAETFPFLGDRKIVLAANADFLRARPQHTDVNHQPDVFLRYLENPAPYSILVITAPYEKVDERKKVVKQLKKVAKAIECKPLQEWNVQDAITTIAQQHNVQIDKEVITYFINEIGTNLMLIHSEMAKLALYVGEGNQIRMKDAETLLSSSENSSALKLMDAIIEKNLTKAINISKDLQKMNEDPIALIALVASQYRTLLQVKLLKQRGFTQQQMASQLKIHTYVAKLSIQRQSKYTLNQLKQAIGLLTETDAQIKTGAMDKSLAFDLLLYQLINQREHVS